MSACLRAWTGLAGWLLCWSAGAAEPPRESFDLRVPFAPAAYALDGRTALVYELQLSNYAAEALNPVGIDVVDADRATVLVRYSGPELAQRLDRSGVQRDAVALKAIDGGRHGRVFVELMLPPGSAVPRHLSHRVEYATMTPSAQTHTVTGARIAVEAAPVAVLGAPLRGGPWVAIYDAGWERGHRRVVYAVDGKARTPGRHAVDWVRLDTQGRKQAADGDRAAEAYSYGEDVLAVADGVIVKVRDDVPERQVLSERARHDLASGSGNVVALDIGGGRYAYYGHLRSGSVRVKIGQRVRKGDVLASVGFSGSASNPQLHFHLGDAPDALAAEGLPFVLERFDALGRYDDIATLGRQAWQPLADTAARARQREMPAGNSVVHFGGEAASEGPLK